jgi:hypothetical protein
LTLDTVPAGADCSLTRKGLVIGHVNPTPGSILVQRTRDDITVSCTRDGYQTGTFVNKSGLEAATFGNIILGGLIGVAIDSASGTNNKYDATMRITLIPGEPGTEQPVALPAAEPPQPAETPARFSTGPSAQPDNIRNAGNPPWSRQGVEAECVKQPSQDRERLASDG